MLDALRSAVAEYGALVPVVEFALRRAELGVEAAVRILTEREYRSIWLIQVTGR